MSENNLSSKRFTREEQIKIVDALSYTILYGKIEIQTHQRFYSAHQHQLQKFVDMILEEKIPWLLALSPEMQVKGVQIAAIYLKFFLDKKELDYLSDFVRMVATTKILDKWGDSKRFFEKVLREKSENKDEDLKYIISDIPFDSFDLYLPAIINDDVACEKMWIDWNSIRDEYVEAVRDSLKQAPAAIPADKKLAFLKSRPVAMKSKILADYRAQWYAQVESWIGKEEKSWDNDFICNPFSIANFLVQETGCGILYRMKNQMVTKQENLTVAESVLYSYESRDQELDRMLAESKSSEFDTLFCLTLIMETLMRDNTRMQKELLRQELKKDNQQSDGYLDALRLDNESLQKQLAESQQTVARLKKENSELYDRYAAAINKVKSLQNRQGNTQKKKEKPVKASVEDPIVEPVEEPEIHEEPGIDYKTEVEALFSKKKIVLIGGNENLLKKFKQDHPTAILIEKRRLGSCDSTVRNADVVLFKTDSLSHTLYTKCKQIATSAGVPVAYVPDTASVAKMEAAIYNVVTDLFKEE